MATPQEIQLPPFRDSISSLAFHPENPDLLLSGNWDSNVYLHDLNQPSNTRKLAQRGAILDVAWGTNSAKAFTAGLTKQVNHVDFETGDEDLIVKHDEAVKAVDFNPDINSVISASWDKTLRLTSPLSPHSSTTLHLPEKVYSVATSKSKIVAAMGARQVWIWDARMLGEVLEKQGAPEPEPWQKRESSLKFMTRAVRCMANDDGYVTTSIEGRVAVEFFNPDAAVQAKKYAFKCHRQVIDGVDTVYPVTGLAFNPVHGTFATGGGDCTVSLWDPAAKKRLRQFPKYPSPISSLEFNANGTKLAVAFSENDDGGVKGEKNGNGIIVRECFEECRPKAKA
ncbi:putative nuclear pore complex subunit [Meredithblackwellia eburnea MCA 4105]